MALTDLVKAAPEDSPEELMRRMGVMVQRTFGAPASDLGRIEMKDGKPALIINHNGADRALTWERNSHGAIFWIIDGKERVALAGETAMKRLVEALNG